MDEVMYVRVGKLYVVGKRWLSHSEEAEYVKGRVRKVEVVGRKTERSMLASPSFVIILTIHYIPVGHSGHNETSHNFHPIIQKNTSPE